MKKINTHQYIRFMEAMEHLAKDFDALEQEEIADELTLVGRELSEAYRFYCFSLKQLKNSTLRFEDAFDTAFARYRIARRLLLRIPSIK